MLIRITRDNLMRHEACNAGLALFDAIAPNGVWEGDWAPLHTCWLATTTPFMGWRSHVGIVVLSSADLRGARTMWAVGLARATR